MRRVRQLGHPEENHPAVRRGHAGARLRRRRDRVVLRYRCSVTAGYSRHVAARRVFRADQSGRDRDIHRSDQEVSRNDRVQEQSVAVEPISRERADHAVHHPFLRRCRRLAYGLGGSVALHFRRR